MAAQPPNRDEDELRAALAELRPDELEALVGALIEAEYQVAVPTPEPGPDRGVDYQVDGPHGRELFIVKRRVPPFPALRAIIEESRVAFTPNRIVLATPEDVSDSTRRRLSMVVGNYVDTWDQPVLLELLARHPQVRARFFEPSTAPPENPLERFVLWLADREARGPRPLPGWVRLVLLFSEKLEGRCVVGTRGGLSLTASG